MKRTLRLAGIAIAGMAFWGGCGRVPEGAGDPATPGFVVHEWGTFTSVQDSRGRTLEGLQHTDEFLPPFVHARSVSDGHGIKSLEALPEPVTQKLETPVLYFYGDVPEVDVQVDFPQGIISEWFPNAASFTPEIGNMSRIAAGGMRWKAALVAPETLQPPAVPMDSVWAPSRQVASRGVRVGVEDEGFIFYRGLGRFELPLRVEGAPGGGLLVTNESDEVIPAAFLLHVHEGGGAVVELGELRGHASVLLASTTPKEHDAELYTRTVADLVARALETTGLYADEARAMVNTWETSYFRSYGLRVLYVVPRAWTDELLPLRLAPAPQELVRTLVGRIEVLSAQEEASIVAELRSAHGRGILLDPDAFGRFTEPKLRRALELIAPDDVTLRRYAEGLLEAAQRMP